jgi:hypothetical protein
MIGVKYSDVATEPFYEMDIRSIIDVIGMKWLVIFCLFPHPKQSLLVWWLPNLTPYYLFQFSECVCFLDIKLYGFTLLSFYENLHLFL